MAQIKKILFPVDFSDACLGAARHMEALAGRFEAGIMLLHVVADGEHNLAGELLPGRQAQLNAFLADELKYFSTERLCVAGDAAAEIVAAAQRWNPDLVMMPTHGLGLFRRVLLGSVTSKVLHDLACPVWTSAHSEAAPPLEDIRCRRILCALDLSERSREVLEWAAWLANEYEAGLGIVYAMPPLPPAYFSSGIEEEYVKSVSAQATREIETLRTQAGTAGLIFLESGEPAAVVASVAKQFDADLVVMGRHSGTGVAGFLREHAHAILRGSPCPVISI